MLHDAKQVLLDATQVLHNATKVLHNCYMMLHKCYMMLHKWILHLMTNSNIVYDTTPNLNHLKSQLISTTSNASISDNSQPNLSNFGFYIPGLILINYIIPHQISSNPTTSNLKISNNLNNLKFLYLKQFSTDLGQLLYSDQS